MDYWSIVSVALIRLLKWINCWLFEMDGWDIEAFSEQSKFQIKLEDHCFVSGYEKPSGFIYLHKFLMIC